jgi:hypothetical protein
VEHDLTTANCSLDIVRIGDVARNHFDGESRDASYAGKIAHQHTYLGIAVEHQSFNQAPANEPSPAGD